jgi:hypothetical protein
MGFEPLFKESFIKEKPDVLAGLFNADRSGSVTLVTFAQIATYAAAQRTTQTCANGGAGLAAQAVTDHRTTGCTNTAADGSFSTTTFRRCNSTAGRARYSSTDRCAGAATHALADHITQRATKTTADRCGAIAGSHRTLSNQKAKNQSRQR